MSRLFIGMSIPQGLREQISTGKILPPGTRAMAPENLHMTLAFIGEAREADVLTAVSALSMAPLRLATLAFGHFQRKIFCLGIEPSTELMALQARLAECLKQHGVPVDSKSYVPHITVARSKQAIPLSAMQAYLNQPVSPFSWGADCFHLYRSELTPQGAKYRQLAKFPG